ncbi:MAG TPA: hypothetical protein VGK85_00020 [Myxococcaceae bacterium]
MRPAPCPERLDPRHQGEIVARQQPLPHGERFGGAPLGEEGLAKGREQLRAPPLPGEGHRSFQPLRRHAERSRAQCRPPGGLEDTDGLDVADQLASHRMLGRLVVETAGMQQPERTGVQPCLHRRTGVLCKGLMEERMDELEPAPSYGPDQPAAMQGLQPRRALLFVEPCDLGGDIGPETQPEHAGDTGEADALRGKPRKPGEQELLLGVAGAPLPHVADRIPLLEDRSHLLQEERVTRAELPGLRHDVVGQGPADQLREQAPGGHLAQRRQRCHLGVALVGQGSRHLMGSCRPRAECADHRDRQRPDPTGHEREQPE